MRLRRTSFSAGVCALSRLSASMRKKARQAAWQPPAALGRSGCPGPCPARPGPRPDSPAGPPQGSGQRSHRPERPPSPDRQTPGKPPAGPERACSPRGAAHWGRNPGKCGTDRVVSVLPASAPAPAQSPHSFPIGLQGFIVTKNFHSSKAGNGRKRLFPVAFSTSFMYNVTRTS